MNKKIFKYFILVLLISFSLFFAASCTANNNDDKEKEQEQQQQEEAQKKKYSFVRFIWNDEDVLAELQNGFGEKKTVEVDSVVPLEVKLYCEEVGSATLKATYAYEGKTYSETKTYELPPVGHNYVFYNITWNSDYSVAIANFVCDNDPTHTKTETLEIKETARVDATCESEGYVELTASLTYDGEEYSSTVRQTLEKTEHIVDRIEYNYDDTNPDNSKIIVYCTNPNHVFNLVTRFTQSIEEESISAGKKIVTTIYGVFQNVTYSKDYVKSYNEDKLYLAGIDSFAEIEGFADSGIRLFTELKAEFSNHPGDYIFIKQTLDKEFIVVEHQKDEYSTPQKEFDYCLYCKDSYYNFEAFRNINVNDYLNFDDELDSKTNYFKVRANESIHVNYDLGYEHYDSKNDLYIAYFTDFYYFLKNNTNINFTKLNISSLDDFLTICKTWRAYGRNEMGGLGDAFGAYYLTKVEKGTFENQPETSFVGWCYKNGKYIELLHHLEVFFGYWRTDEGYSQSDPHGNDFFYSPWASFVDTCKFFYFTSANITDTYSWYTYQRSPRVHYMLDNVPGIEAIELVNDTLDPINLPTLSRNHFEFKGWYDDNDNQVVRVTESMNVHAKWYHIAYDVTFISGGEENVIKSYEGYRVPQTTFVKTGYSVYKYIDSVTGEEVDELSTVERDLYIYVTWESKVSQVASFRIYSLNTESETSEVTQYNGARIYQHGVEIDASLYWLKLIIEVQDDKYIITNVVPSGESTPKNYDYIILVYSGDSTGTYDALIATEIEVGKEIFFDKELSGLANGAVNLNASISGGFDSTNNLVLIADPENKVKVPAYNQCLDHYDTLPSVNRSGYNFLGWYKSGSNTPITSIDVDGVVVLFALYEEKVYNDILDYIPDVITSNSCDTLPIEFNDSPVTWSVSNNNLLSTDGFILRTNRMNQLHTSQSATVTATIDGVRYSKTVTIAPVEFDKASHPLAVYFSVGSAGSYKNYSQRYKQENTLFSEKFKNGFDFLYYAFAIPEIDGTITLNDSYMSEVIKLKNNNIRLSLVIDGANASALENLVQVCNDTTLRAKFINSIMDTVVNYNLDGVDIDWEFPGTSGLSGYTTELDIQNMNSLLRELRAKMTELQDEGGSDYMLSCATPPTYWGTDRFDYQTINQYCDYVNMMSYDLNKSGNTSHVTHVHIPSNNYSYKFSCEYGISYYSSLGLDKSKIILGAAAYGKAYKVTGNVDMSVACPALGVAATLGQVQGYNIPLQSVSWASGTIYYTGIQTLINSGNFTLYHEYNNAGNFVGSYIYSNTDKYFVTFDSVKALQEKCKLAKSYDGMGIMVWAYGEDATDTVVNTLADNIG